MNHDARFHALFSEHYPVVARYVLARGYQAADADDLIAETFEIAWRRLDAVPEDRDAVPWLLTVARNLSRNTYRKTQRELAVLDRLASSEPTWSGTSSEDGLDWSEVRAALGSLKALDRDLILLVAWDGLTPGEAGEVLGLRPVTARSRLHRARQRLAQLVKTGPSESSRHDPLDRTVLTPITQTREDPL